MSGLPNCTTIRIVGYPGVYVDNLLIAGHCTLNDKLIEAVKEIWKTSTPEHVGL